MYYFFSMRHTSEQKIYKTLKSRWVVEGLRESLGGGQTHPPPCIPVVALTYDLNAVIVGNRRVISNQKLNTIIRFNVNIISETCNFLNCHIEYEIQNVFIV